MFKTSVLAGALTATLAFAPSMSSAHALRRRAPAMAATARNAPSGVPSYVLDYAPLLWLHSEDPYLPASLEAHLQHTTPQVNFQPVNGTTRTLTLDNLDQLNSLGNTSVYLTSNDDITTNPTWLRGEQPSVDGVTDDVTNVVIVTDHGNGNVDAFYMYFYSYDWAGLVSIIDQNLNNHVGDWEHNMVRFVNGTPTAIWYSQHANGEAFTYDAVEKFEGDEKRPVAYSANGTHANYGYAGTHDHLIPNLNLPGGLLEDHCDQGSLFDPVANAYFYEYDTSDGSFIPYDDDATITTPVGFLNYNGQWGDEEYPDSDPRQSDLFGFPKYASGPNGPKFKQLDREDVCPDNGIACIVRPIMTP